MHSISKVIPATTAPGWRGYWRPPDSRAWRQLAEGPTEAETVQRLLDAMERGRLSGGFVVLPAEKTP